MIFDYAEFHLKLNFTNFNSASLSFKFVKFKNETNFNTSFNNANYDSSEFFKETSFEDSFFSYKGMFSFKNVIFYGKASFKDARFAVNSNLDFRNIRFNSLANFSCKIGVKKNQDIEGIFPEIIFNGSTFDEVKFTNRHFTAKTDFSWLF